MTAPAAVTQTTGPGAPACAATVSDAALDTAVATDNLTQATVTRSGVPDGDLFPVGTSTILYTATDLAGNSAAATQLVTVVDTRFRRFRHRRT